MEIFKLIIEKMLMEIFQKESGKNMNQQNTEEYNKKFS